MNTRRLVIWITFLAIVAMAARISVDTDTWWHLRAGQWMVENREILLVDLFSYTRYGQPWQYPGWLVEVLMYLVYSAFGPGGLNMWTAVMVALTFGFVWRTMQGCEFLRAFTLILAATVSGVYWAARPYLVTFLLAAVYLWILEMFRWRADVKSARRLWWLPILMVVWANSHGGFAVGFLLWGVYGTGELVHWLWAWIVVRRREKSVRYKDARQNFLLLGFVGLLMLVAVCLNPSGPGVLLYPFKTVGIGSLQNFIQEWQSPNFHDLEFQPFVWLLVILIGAIGASRRRLALTDFLLIAGFAYMGLMAGRNVALFALVAPMVITRQAEPLLTNIARMFLPKTPLQTQGNKTQRFLNSIILGVVTLAVLFRLYLVYPQEVNQAYFTVTLPVQAVEAVRTLKPPGYLFNSYNFGGYLVWALPEYPVFVDGRTDLYNDEILSQWLQVMRADDGWQEVMNEWNVRLVLVEPETPLVEKLSQTGWSELFRSETAVVYAK